MRKSLIIITFVCLLLGCSIFESNSRPLWTMFVYMAADNGLYNFALDDIIEMQKGLLLNDSVRIIVFIKHSSFYSDGRVEYLEILPNNADFVSSRRLQTFRNLDSGSGDTLLRFMNWAYSRYASNRNIMVIWSHSDGWIRSGSETLGIGMDANFGTKIGVSTGELRNAFERHGKRYDIIILDACTTGSLEIITELEGFADYIIASPAPLNAIGFPWTKIIETWDSGTRARELTRMIIEHTKDAYSWGGIYNNSHFDIRDRDISVSVYAMDKLNDLIEAIKEFSATFSNPEYVDFFASIRERVYFIPFGIDIEFHDFVNLIREENDFTQEQRDIIENLCNAINDFVIDNVTLHAMYSPHFHKRNLVSIMYPQHISSFIDLYEQHWSNLRFSRSGWGEFLKVMSKER